MLISENIFTYIPLAAMLCNTFLFLTCLSAKKNRVVFSFLLLMLSFTAWTAGSYFMRSLAGGDELVLFWCDLSLTGIFAMPVTFYTFIYYYTNKKGIFSRSLIQVPWIIIIIFNFFDVFIKNPSITSSASGGKIFDFEFTYLIALPVALTVVTFGAIIKMIYDSVTREGVSIKKYLPLILGAAILLLGVSTDIIPGLKSFPSDTLACAINAFLIYYALYKSRTISLVNIASSSPTFLISAIFTTVILSASYDLADRFYAERFPNYADQKTIVLVTLYSMLTIVIFTLLRRLTAGLFVRNAEIKDSELKEFSQNINRTLNLNEILTIYKQFLLSKLKVDRAYICISSGDIYTLYDHFGAASGGKTTLSMSVGNPLAVWLRDNGRSIYYSDFQRTNSYRAMWESEKRQLAGIGAKLIIPIMSDDELVGFTIFGGVSSGAARGTADVAYIESATAIVSIAIKNAMLYRRIEDEANRDSLTNLYNRRHFIQRIRGDFDAGSVVSMTLAIISFDDFRLYNELYGSYEGDRIIKSFAEILLGAVKGKGTVARLGGKEFILALPFHDPAQARELLARIKDMLEQRLGEVAEHGIRYLTFSAGICEYPSSATNFDELMTYANMALYTAKCSGKNRFEEYSPVHFDEFERQRLDMEYKKSIAENCEPTILALVAAIDAKDHYTFRHSINVSEYASALARAISLDSVHVEMIRQAGLMHDVGKIGISDSILSKQSELTDEEYEIMKQHVDGSIAMIRHIPSLDYVIPIAIGHHERWDGKGYPRGLSGDEIPIGARCLCIADSFDAMITRRPYREGLSVEHALEEIKNGLGAQYDPDLGKVFISLVRSGAINIKLQNEAV